MAEAFAKKLGLNAASAGTLPSQAPNPLVVLAMSEAGVDISSSIPKKLNIEMINEADTVITMGCSVEQACPRPLLVEMNKKMIDWDLADPKGMAIEEIRVLRDEIKKRVSVLAESAEPGTGRTA